MYLDIKIKFSVFSDCDLLNKLPVCLLRERELLADSDSCIKACRHPSALDCIQINGIEQKWKCFISNGVLSKQ